MAFNIPSGDTSGDAVFTSIVNQIHVDGVNVKVLPNGTPPTVVYRIGDGTVHADGFDNVLDNEYLDFYVSSGTQGIQGEKGEDGLSAYDQAVAGGYAGTPSEFYALLTEVTDNAILAEDSATAAALSETAAGLAQTAAELAETNAALSETQASNSAIAASTSEDNAATSEGNASTSETNAANSASSASGSAAAATTSASNAATSESNASTSETNAATSATGSQLRAWEAEAEKMTADSYATEAEDVFVKTYTSDGDGTFTASDTTEYSALHWSAKSEGYAGAAITDVPTLSGGSSVVELNDLVVTITNYSSAATYDIVTTSGTANRVGDTITVSAGSVTADTAHTLTVTATEPSHLVSTGGVHNFTVTNVTLQNDTDYSINVTGSAFNASNYPNTYIADGSTNASTTDYTAIHTSATSSTGTASASSTETSYDAWKALDGLDTATVGWATAIGTTTGWWNYLLTQSTIINKVIITGSASVGRSPKDFTIRGSNDGFVADDNILSTITGKTDWVSSVDETFAFTNSTAYTSYRIDCTANNGDTQFFTLQEVKLIEAEIDTYGATGGYIDTTVGDEGLIHSLLNSTDPFSDSSLVSGYRFSDDLTDMLSVNDGTASGTVTYENGTYGKRVVVASGKIDLGAGSSALMPHNADYSVSGTFVRTDGVREIFASRMNAATVYGDSVYYDTDNKILVQFAPTVSTLSTFTTNVLSYDDGEEHTWAVTVNRTSGVAILYIDNVIVPFATSGTVPAVGYDNSLNTLIGAWHNNNYSFTGDETRFFNKVLSVTEVEEMHNFASNSDATFTSNSTAKADADGDWNGTQGTIDYITSELPDVLDSVVYGTVDSVETHTTYIGTNGTASASSELGGNYVAWKAVDDSTTHTWYTNSISTGWWQYAYNVAKTINKVNITGDAEIVPLRCLKDFTIRGSNDNFVADDNVLDTVVGETSWGQNEVRTFTFTNDTAYTHYRIDVTANNGDAILQIAEVELIESTGDILLNGNHAPTDYVYFGDGTDFETVLMTGATYRGETLDNTTEGTNITLSNGDLTATTSASSFTENNSFSTAITEGNVYFEVTVDVAGDAFNRFIGFSTNNTDQASYIGAAVNGYTYYGDGNKYNNGASAYGTGYTAGDTIGCRYSYVTGEIEFYKWNGSAMVSQGIAWTITAGTTLYMAQTLYANTSAHTVNFGETAFLDQPIGTTKLSGLTEFTHGQTFTPTFACKQDNTAFQVSFDDVNYYTPAKKATGNTFEGYALDVDAIFDTINNGTNITLSNGNLTATSTLSGWTSINSYGLLSVSKGNIYFEVTVNLDSASNIYIGLSTINTKQDNYFNAASTGYAYDDDGQKNTGGVGSAYGASYTTGDVVGCRYSYVTGEIEFYKNGVSQGIAWTITPNTVMYPSVAIGTSGDNVTINFGATAFAYTQPSGTTALALDGNIEIKEQLDSTGVVANTGTQISHKVTHKEVDTKTTAISIGLTELA